MMDNFLHTKQRGWHEIQAVKVVPMTGVGIMGEQGWSVKRSTFLTDIEQDALNEALADGREISNS